MSVEFVFSSPASFQFIREGDGNTPSTNGSAQFGSPAGADLSGTWGKIIVTFPTGAIDTTSGTLDGTGDVDGVTVQFFTNEGDTIPAETGSYKALNGGDNDDAANSPAYLSLSKDGDAPNDGLILINPNATGVDYGPPLEITPKGGGLGEGQFDFKSLTEDGNIDGDNIVVCFGEGTLIATPQGDRAVETLAIGDLILTSDGRAVPVKWIGRQSVHKLFTPATRFCPVRISKGALAENTPQSDLVVTSDHGILVGEVMVNAGALVNGTTIARVPADALADRVTYYHVETENHDVILAAGTPAETFVDATTRRAFDNYEEYVAAFGEETRSMPVLSFPRAISRRQVPEHVRRQLAERAAALGHDDVASAA